jgi:hypothetical protein
LSACGAFGAPAAHFSKKKIRKTELENSKKNRKKLSQENRFTMYSSTCTQVLLLILSCSATIFCDTRSTPRKNMVLEKKRTYTRSSKIRENTCAQLGNKKFFC